MVDTPALAPVTGVPDQSGDATNAVLRNQQMGKLVSALSESGTDYVAAIDAITAAVVASLLGGTTGVTANRLLRSKGTTGLALQNTIVGCDDSGNLTGARSLVLTNNTAYAVLCGGTTTSNPIQSVASVGTLGQPLVSAGAGALPAFGSMLMTEAIGSVILVGAVQNYLIGINMPFGGTLVTTTTKCTSGTATLVTRINGVNVTGLSNAVSTSEVTSTATALNTFVAGDDISVAITVNSSCLNLSFMIKATRSSQ